VGRLLVSGTELRWATYKSDAYPIRAPGSAQGEGPGGDLGGLPLGELGLLSGLLDLMASDPDPPPTGSTAPAAALR